MNTKQLSWQLCLILLLISCNISNKKDDSRKMKCDVSKRYFGQIKNDPINLYTLYNENGMRVEILNYGGIIKSIYVPDSKGQHVDVVLGFDNLEGYLSDHPYFGVIVGRYANRIENGSFSLNGNSYQLAKNNGENHLHGGITGFDKKVWNASVYVATNGDARLELELESKDGDEGYPGKMKIKVFYVLNAKNEFKIEYNANTDAPTIVNLTNHSYFNLNGEGKGNILNHQLQILASKYTPVDENLIPAGKFENVAGTPFDFLNYSLIGDRINEDIDQLKKGGGYDHNYVIDEPVLDRPFANVESDETGIVMSVSTNKPGVQLYTGNFLDSTLKGKNNLAYGSRSGFCLETQFFPDSPNNPSFPSAILIPGANYSFTTIYKFSVRK